MVLCCLEECTKIWVRFQHSGECNLLHLIAVNISRHQCSCAITCFQSFVRNLPVFCSVAMLKLESKTWRPLFEFFVQNFNIGILKLLVVDNPEPSFAAEPTNQPTNRPTNRPTDQPANQPTNQPTNQPNRDCPCRVYYMY